MYVFVSVCVYIFSLTPPTTSLVSPALVGLCPLVTFALPGFSHPGLEGQISMTGNLNWILWVIVVGGLLLALKDLEGGSILST